MKKRLAILIAAAMLFTSMPFYVFADGNGPADGQTVNVTDGENNGEGDEQEITVTITGNSAVKKYNGSKQSVSGFTTDAGDKNINVALKEGKTAKASGTEIGVYYMGLTEDHFDVTSEEYSNIKVVVVDGKLTIKKPDKGWNKDHTVYYDKNGKALANTVKKIKGVYYYFNKKGKLDMSNGWKTVGKNRYYVKKGKIVTKPTKIKSKKTVTKKVKYYYNKKTKKWQTKEISGAKTKYKQKKVNVSYLYMFRTNGKLKTTKGLFKYNGKEYYGTGKGRLKTGWKAFTEKKKHKAAFFNKKTGAMVKNTKVGYLQVPKNGRLGEAYYLGIKNLDKIGWSLRKAYRYSARIRYQGRSYRAKNSETYAIKGFTKGYGNCYVMAATFYIQAKLLGYDVHQVAGRVDLPHSWTVIKQDGREWVYDPNFTNETGRNGWKIRYGQKGTWRYNHYHKMN